MNIFQSIILGIVQGLTEFLPISSSGHLVLVPHLLGWQIPPEEAFVFDILVQVATLFAVFAYFWKDLLAISTAFLRAVGKGQPFSDPSAREAWFIVVATIPAGVIGFLLKDIVEAAFNSLIATSLFLFFTAALLILGEWAAKRKRAQRCHTWKDALWIGFFQAMAIFPGVSRSGATISGGMIRDLERPAAARISFLMSIPIMLGAGGAAAFDLLEISNLGSVLPAFIPGFLSAAVVGYLAIRWLLGYLIRHPLYVFAVYCTVVGFLALAVNFMGL